MNHEDLRGVVDLSRSHNFVSGTPDPNPQSFGNGFYFSTNAHGTHVAGLAAAVAGNGIGVAGVAAPGSKVLALNVFGSAATTDGAAVENAIRYAADKGAKVINLSLAIQYGQSATTEAAIQYALSKGVTLVIAAGNAGIDLDVGPFVAPQSYSTRYPGVIAVSMTYLVGGSTVQIDPRSNYGASSVEIAAPGGGGGLLSTIPKFIPLMPGAPLSSYGSMPGTSMASPLVAGAASLVIGFVKARTGVYPSPATVEALLTGGADRLPQLESSIIGGRHLNLLTLARHLERLYPAAARAEITGVLNFASRSIDIAPLSWAVVEGTGLASSESSGEISGGNSMPQTLGGISVAIDGEPMRLISVSPTRIVFIAPESLRHQALLTVLRNGVSVASASVRSAEVSPGILTVNGSTPIAFVTSFGSSLLSWPPPIYPVWQLPIFFSRPGIQRWLTILGTGLRKRTDLSSVGLRLNGESLPVSYAGPAATDVEGIDAVTAELPLAVSGAGTEVRDWGLSLEVQGRVANQVRVKVFAP